MAQEANNAISGSGSKPSENSAPQNNEASDKNPVVQLTVPQFSGGQLPSASSTKAPEKIRFVAADDFPPFAFRDSEQRLMGYNVDLARELCQSLKIACSLEVKPFDELVRMVTDNRADAVIAGVSVTPNTLEQLKFSQVYMRFPGRFVVANDSFLNPLPDTLRGKRIGVVKGSRHEAFLERFFGTAIPVSYDSEALQRNALVNKDIDGLFGDGMRLSFWLDTAAAQKCCKFAGGPWLDPSYFGSGLAIGTRPDDLRTLNAINLGLARLQSNGRLGELYLRYFPRGFF